ncbi:MAG: VPLPA-CTERM sorting domain-containing protein [Spongiibacteraceae bacterium]
MKKLLMTSAAAALLTAAQAQAALYEISYSYVQQGKYTSSKPLVNGTPDPNGTLGPSGSATHNIPPVAINGTGTLDTVTGEIYLAPIDIEINVTSGSYGYVGWSQTLHGSFSGTTYTMVGKATVNGGSAVCELVTSSSCTDPAVGGVGALPPALNPPQLYKDPVLNIFGQVVTPGGPLTLTNIVFSSLSTGGSGTYLFQDNAAPAYADTTIVMTLGNDITPAVPVPAAAWLFGSAVLGLGGLARKRRS